MFDTEYWVTLVQECGFSQMQINISSEFIVVFFVLKQNEKFPFLNFN